MDYSKVSKELEDLVTETYKLWDHNRVGFQWRHYTWNHTKRVRAMGMELGRREGGDVKKLEIAGTLHDITKKYGISGVPVVDKNILVGIVTNRDLRFVDNLNTRINYLHRQQFRYKISIKLT